MRPALQHNLRAALIGAVLAFGVSLAAAPAAEAAPRPDTGANGAPVVETGGITFGFHGHSGFRGFHHKRFRGHRGLRGHPGFHHERFHPRRHFRGRFGPHARRFHHPGFRHKRHHPGFHRKRHGHDRHHALPHILGGTYLLLHGLRRY